MSYPDIDDKKFNNKINNKYKNYTVSKKKKTFKQICYPSEYKLQPQQKFLSKYINPNTPYKGVLVFHRIGAGKTCTAVRIGEAWKEKRKVIVVVPASLQGNFRDELRSRCAKNEYLTDSERKKLKKYHPSSDKYKSIMKKSDKRINKYYKIYSYNKFVDLASNDELSLKNSILIIDEIQNMVSEDGVYYNTLYDTIYDAPDSLRVVLLSATPMFDKPIEIALTMNLLRIPYEFPTGREFEKMFIKAYKNSRTGKYYYRAKNLDIFKERIKGYISYYRGAPPYVFPEASIRYVKCDMSNFQYRSYLTVLKKEERESGISKYKRRKRAFKKGSILKLPNNFFIGTRLISNIAFPNKHINEKGYKSLDDINLDLENIKQYSIKFYKIIKSIQRSRGPVYVYCNFTEYGGIKTFVKILEANGYKYYKKHGEGRKRFAIWSGNENNKKREEIKAVFNQPKNHDGSKLRILILSSAGKEGISLKNCRQAHILSPYWNNSMLEQVIGRGVRYCSHKGLPEEDRYIKVYIYLATHPDEEETIDEYIRKMASKKNKLIKEFETAMKESAIDCELFKNANVYKGEEDIICDI